VHVLQWSTCKGLWLSVLAQVEHQSEHCMPLLTAWLTTAASLQCVISTFGRNYIWKPSCYWFFEVSHSISARYISSAVNMQRMWLKAWMKCNSDSTDNSWKWYVCERVIQAQKTEVNDTRCICVQHTSVKTTTNACYCTHFRPSMRYSYRYQCTSSRKWTRCFREIHTY